MILVRNVFQLKFGKARDAVALWKEGNAILAKRGFSQSRLLTDLTGPAYTLVLETTFASLGDWEKSVKDVFGAPEWGAWYQRFVPLAESSHREIFTIVE